MKKYMKILVPLLIVFLALIVFLLFFKKENTNVENRVIVKEESFTITDIGTQIKVSLRNNGVKDKNIKAVKAYLIEENKDNHIIIKKVNKVLKKGKSMVITLKSNEKYLNVSKVRYSIIN